jgi:hypothetical protein
MWTLTLFPNLVSAARNLCHHSTHLGVVRLLLRIIERETWNVTASLQHVSMLRVLTVTWQQTQRLMTTRKGPRSSEDSEKSNDLIWTLRHAWPRATRHDQTLPEHKNRHAAINMIYVNGLWTVVARNMESSCRTKCSRFLFRLATSLTASRVQLTTRTSFMNIQN